MRANTDTLLSHGLVWNRFPGLRGRVRAGIGRGMESGASPRQVIWLPPAIGGMPHAPDRPSDSDRLWQATCGRIIRYTSP